MPAPASNAELFELIAKSGVLESAKVQGFVAKLAASPGGVPSDPIKLGEILVRDGLLTHFQAEQLLQGRWKRFHIGKYKVLERIGVGGMGQVFLCEHKLMKRRVAVKVLPAAKAKDEASLQRFYREARAVAAVDHPNIVRAYDIDDDNDLHFLVMEFVDGINLHDMTKRNGTIPVLRACHYMYQSAVGLQHAHEMGLIHRDIKPANILVDRSGVVKILDMGLARFFHPDEGDNLTQKFDENVLGTADYLAPEQAIDSSGVDIRADLYGLGGTFYFMLTGFPPFPDGTVAQKLLWHQSKPPKPITDYRSDVPPPIQALVLKLLAKKPEDRFQSPAEVMVALAPWVQTPIPPPPESEMPVVSLAAGGRSPGSGAPLNTGGGTSGRINPAPSAPKPQFATPTMPLKPPSSVGQPPRPAVVAAAISKPTAPVAVAIPALKPAPVANPWEDIGYSETIPTSAENTARTHRTSTDDRPQSSRTRRTSRSAKKTKSLNWLWVLLGILGGGALLGGGFAALVAFNVFGTKKVESTFSAAAKEAEPKIWYLAKSGNGPDPETTRATLNEVVEKLKAGDTLVLLDDVVEAPGNWRAMGLKNLTVRGNNPAKPTQWIYKPPASVKAHPKSLVDIQNCENVTIRNVAFDAGNLLDIGVQVSGVAHGVTLDQIEVRNAKRFGIQLQQVAGEAGRPVKVQKCRVVGSATNEAAIAVVGTAPSSYGVRIDQCRLESVAKGAGIRLEGGVFDTEIRNNRLFNFETGFALAAFPGEGQKFEAHIERNTLHTINVGLHAETPLPTFKKLTVTRNYFAATAVIGQTTGDPKTFALSENGRDAVSKPGTLASAEVPGNPISKPSDATPDNQFLRSTGLLKLGNTIIGTD